MKKYTLIPMIIFGCAIRMMAQSQHDYSLVMQKCIDLKELQQYYPRTEAGQVQQLYILQHGEPFPANMSISKNGKKPKFISKQDANASGTTAYFMFHEFKIANNTARVEFLYQYNNTNNITHFVAATLDLQMKDNTWTITQRNIELR